ncbi:hypothetical protein [Paenibacillus crassostreae]|uniref:DUF1232 domain-containing protein n=1 Tax=Paenibacillus crassostreae TaxID=1763538 RepID=A0A167FYA1_9BACL|nr:hypothetical protein [Paenibacillus crassostreae]AOZ94788.1 hypothetical protein LPB68_18335 [Paenibacillus crassostreae]OAB77018.1 hypothetical protein PNBC_06405 [Paenibacillus crassostreae]
MKLRRLLSYKHWITVLGNLRRYVFSPQVALVDKLMFLIPVIVYWVFPLDLIPGLPIDDIGVTVILMKWFTSRIQRKYPNV